MAELMATRAVISGRRTYEHADRWQGDQHDGVPLVRCLTTPGTEEPAKQVTHLRYRINHPQRMGES